MPGLPNSGEHNPDWPAGWLPNLMAGEALSEYTGDTTPGWEAPAPRDVVHAASKPSIAVMNIRPEVLPMLVGDPTRRQ